MVKRTLVVSTLAVGLSLSAGYTWAAAPEAVKEQVQVQTQEQVYGSQLMTKQERLEYQNKMRATTTAEEREQIRKEHHEQMQVRAKERGVTLPDSPPVGGKGMRPGSDMMGPGGGMGTGGGGMGTGGGRGR
jgi:hypothetical protein